MANKHLKYALIAITAFFYPLLLSAQDSLPPAVITTDSISGDVVQTVVSEVTTVTTIYSDGTSEERVLAEGETIDSNGRIISQKADEFDESKRVGIARGFSHFTWGMETGMSLDLSGLDMSTFNLDVMFGYRNKWIQMAGVGGGVHKSLGSSDSFFPVYAVFRSSFRPKPSLCFFHLRVGYSFNAISNSPTYGDTSCAIGCGLNLTNRRKFQSYLLVAYSFRHFNRKHSEAAEIHRSNVSLAQIGFGVTF